MSRKSVFAMLALVMMLGVAMPSVGAFASDGTLEALDAGGKTDDTNTETTTDADSTALEASYVLSFAELFSRVQTGAGFKEYRDNAPLVDAYITFLNASATAKTVLEDIDKYSAGGLHIAIKNDDDQTFQSDWNTKLSADTKTKINNVQFYNAIATLKQDPLYTTDAEFKKFIDGEEAAINAAKAVIVEKLSAVYPTEATTIQGMSMNELLKKFDAYMKTEEKFASWLALALYDDVLVNEGLVVTASDGTKMLNTVEITKKYEEDKIVTAYAKYAAVAVQVDPEAAKGLAAYKLPQTGVETPEAPDTGLVAMIEEGSIDMGLVVMVVLSAVVAIAGVGFVAKLYVKHKF